MLALSVILVDISTGLALHGLAVVAAVFFGRGRGVGDRFGLCTLGFGTDWGGFSVGRARDLVGLVRDGLEEQVLNVPPRLQVAFKGQRCE